MVDKNEPRMVPTDIEGHPLPELTPEQLERKKELEYDRLMKTASKGIYNKWSREEKHILISWAQKANYDLTVSEFKDIVEAFIAYKPLGKNYVLRSIPKMDNSGRSIDALCMYCARIHTLDVPVGERNNWVLPAPCVLSKKPKMGEFTIDDKHISLAKWELKWLDEFDRSKPDWSER